MPVPSQDVVVISKENFAYLQQHVYRQSGIVLDETKQYLVEARLLPIVRKEKLQTIDDLCALIRATDRGRISREVVEAMTTNETFFFRDAAPFKALKDKLLPPIIEKRKTAKRLSFWSAAASSGQEAYSLAIMLSEMGLSDWNIDILGTDINERMVERAQLGSYVQIEMNRGLPAAYLVKYFERNEMTWRVKPALRKMVRFEKFDLRQPPRNFGPFDFILCRNVLIYFDIDTKRSILRGMEKVLNAGGYLLLGAAESTMNLTDVFERQAFENVSFYRKK